MQPSSKTIQGKLARASRRDANTDPAVIARLRSDYHAAVIAEFVTREVRKAPMMTAEQLARISRAMRGTDAKAEKV